MTSDLALDLWLASAQEAGRAQTKTAQELLAMRVMRSAEYQAARERAKKLVPLCSVEGSYPTAHDRAVFNGSAL